MGAPRLTRAEIPMLGEGETPFIRENFYTIIIVMHLQLFQWEIRMQLFCG